MSNLVMLPKTQKAPPYRCAASETGQHDWSADGALCLLCRVANVERIRLLNVHHRDIAGLPVMTRGRSVA